MKERRTITLRPGVTASELLFKLALLVAACWLVDRGHEVLGGGIITALLPMAAAYHNARVSLKKRQMDREAEVAMAAANGQQNDNGLLVEERIP